MIIEEPKNVEQFVQPRALGAPSPPASSLQPPAFEEPLFINEFANSIIHPDTNKEMEYRHLIRNPTHKGVWTSSFARELLQLAQGNETIMGTETIGFIQRAQIPKGRKVTYGRIIVDYHPQKDDPYQTRLTVGGDRIDYPWDKSTPTAGLTTSKVLFN